MVTALFEPTELLEAAVTLTLHGVDGALGNLVATGTGVDPWAKAHTLHPVVDGDTVFAEPDSVGGAVVRSFASLFPFLHAWFALALDVSYGYALEGSCIQVYS